ncbi:MAG: hypothetical protein ABFD89_23745 [Bryobacteraceae bacterium]
MSKEPMSPEDLIRAVDPHYVAGQTVLHDLYEKWRDQHVVFLQGDSIAIFIVSEILDQGADAADTLRTAAADLIRVAEELEDLQS